MLTNSDIQALPERFQATPEFRLVAACSWMPKSNHAQRQNHMIDSLSQSGINWADVTSLVLRHGVVGQFCAVMGKIGWSHVPIETSELLKRLRTEQVARALGQVAELKRVAGCFAEAGIAIIPLKGVALSQELYGNPCIRTSCDLDVLVKLEDVSAAEAQLTRLGYRHALGFHCMHENQKNHIIDTLHHHEYVNDSNGVHIELHWRSYQWTKDQSAALWVSCRPSAWLDCGLQQLSPEDTVLFLLDHGMRHGWPCIKWLSDVAMLLEKLPDQRWHTLLQRATFFDLQRVVAQTALLVKWFYGIDAPQQISVLAATDVVVHKTSIQAASLLLNRFDEFPFLERKFPGLSTAVRIRTLKPATPLMNLLRGSLITHDDFIACPLPDRLFLLYILLRPYFWFRRRCLKR